MMSATELQQGWDDHLSTKRGASHLSFVGIPPPRIVRRLRVMMRRTPAIWDRGSLLEGQCEVRRQPSRCINPRSSTRRTASLITAGGAPVFSRYQSAPGTSTTADGWAESTTILVPGQIDLICRAASDRKSTRLNSSHITISYAVFC